MRSLGDTLRPLLPAPAKDVLRAGIRGFGTATSAARTLPDFVIIGAQKCGTTALYSYLLRHPGIAGPYRKEVEFFDENFARGLAWYRGHFPTVAQRTWVRARHGLDLLAGEASPSYVFHPLAARRVASVLPDARLILLLRNPVDRALSQYNHEVVSGRETLSFEDALDAEPQRLEGELERMEREPDYVSPAWRYQSYLARGRYAEQLRRWLDVVPRERLLVISSADLFDDPGAAYAEVLRFVGAPPHELPSYPAVLAREYEPMRPETRERLEGYFRGPNAELYELLGRDLGWS